MAKSDQGELIAAELTVARTQDGVTHSGAVFRPAGSANGGGPQPVPVVWVRGGGQNFYCPSYLRIGRAVAALGHPFLSVNTRGRDIAAGITPPWWTPSHEGARGSERRESGPMGARTRPPYPPAFRAEAVQLVHANGRSLGQVAKDLGCTTRRCAAGSSRPLL